MRPVVGDLQVATFVMETEAEAVCCRGSDRDRMETVTCRSTSRRRQEERIFGEGVGDAAPWRMVIVSENVPALMGCYRSLRSRGGDG